MHKLQSKVAVITGGNSGIGLAAAQAFVQVGAKVAISGRDKKTLEGASELLGGALALQADVTDVKQMEQFYRQVAQRLGKIDVLFLNAGVAKFAPVVDTTEALFDEMFDINVKGVFFSAQQALPYLNDNASIILNSSVVDSVGWAGTSVYSAAKAAVRSLARTLSADLLSRGIRVNAVSPGPITTPIFGRMGLPKEATDALAQSILARVPMKRFRAPAEVANAVIFFASPDSSYVTGAELHVGGGIGEL
ncbi:MAG TPA: SDR family oxidoreductase [Bryobacteraceae bacterium]|nr:SDR family oxidoreductase [Bryobacteraceae bacterium]HXJ38610.1 SDR family oxidoreductase [Bryobacteraceae bacterium]